MIQSDNQKQYQTCLEDIQTKITKLLIEVQDKLQAAALDLTKDIQEELAKQIALLQRFGEYVSERNAQSRLPRKNSSAVMRRLPSACNEFTDSHPSAARTRITFLLSEYASPGSALKGDSFATETS